MLLTQLEDLGHVDEVADLLLDGGQADVAVQLREKILDLLRRQLLLPHLRLLFLAVGGGGLVLLHRAGARYAGPVGGLAHVGKGGAPEVVVHALEVVLRHGADDLQLLQNDGIFLVHMAAPYLLSD